MEKPTDPYIILGEVGSTYGIKGWLKIQSYTEETAGILDYQPWHLSKANSWEPFSFTDGKPHGKGVVVKFKGFDTPEAAKTLTGRKIAVKREQLPVLAADEFYWADLEGLEVFNDAGVRLGKVVYMLATGSNDVFVLEDLEGHEHAIPYRPGEVVKKVDLAAGTITVAWDLL